MLQAQIDDRARTLGWTRRIDVAIGCMDLSLWVGPKVDLDDRFQAVCVETGDVLYVNGWLITSVEGGQ